jgi:two-component system response regulator CpxR
MQAKVKAVPMYASGNHERLFVLLIDDDVELCSMLKEYFAQLGHRLDCAHTGPDGLARALEGSYKIVLLDVMLPFVNGFSVLQQLRRRKEVPVIMLTARVNRDDRIAGLNKGADDYVTKPFDADELLARIHAVLRRTGGLDQNTKLIRMFEDIEIDMQTREVRVEGRLIDLTALEFDILDMLVRSAGRIVSRDEITETLLDRGATPYDRALDVHVSHLRGKLEHGRSLIRTIRGVGYMFTAQRETHS